MASHHAVQEAVLTATSHGARRPTAGARHARPGQLLDVRQVRQWLREQLPVAMVPAWCGCMKRSPAPPVASPDRQVLSRLPLEKLSEMLPRTPLEAEPRSCSPRCWLGSPSESTRTSSTWAAIRWPQCG